jgi:hypothetical protein
MKVNEDRLFLFLLGLYMVRPPIRDENFWLGLATYVGHFALLWWLILYREKKND